MRPLPSFLVLLLSVTGVAPAGARVEVRTGADGLPLIVNESPVQHARRAAEHFVPLPEDELESLIERHAEEQSLEPRLVRAVMQVESGYNPVARSIDGAMGLMQLMPDTARELAVADPWDPEQNVRGGTAYLRKMLDRFDGDLHLALAGYNAGPEAVDRWGGVPPYSETRSYIERVMRLVSGDADFHLPAAVSAGRPTYVLRGADGEVVITTRRPGAGR